MTIPVLFDTDIGNDIDDAVALAYLLNEPNCELLGITTVTGDTGKRAALAEAVCRTMGRTNIPIYAGLMGPLLHGCGQPDVPQYRALENTEHRADFGTPSEAVLFLRDTIRARPGKITLLAVGPMTNIAALFTLDPEIPSLLKRFVVMCGVFDSLGPRSREWNALVDPVSTAIVYRHAAPGTMISVGLDVTLKCRMDAEECRERFRKAGGALSFVLEMAEVWFEKEPHITFHDPLAATLLFDESICTLKRGDVSVWINDDPLHGMTLWKPNPVGQHDIASDVDVEKFFERYFAITGGA